MTKQQRELLRYQKTQHFPSSLTRPRAGSRVLCLDGGGVRGLIQIEVTLNNAPLTTAVSNLNKSSGGSRILKEGLHCPERFRLRSCVRKRPGMHARKRTKWGFPRNPLDSPLKRNVETMGPVVISLPLWSIIIQLMSSLSTVPYATTEWSCFTIFLSSHSPRVALRAIL